MAGIEPLVEELERSYADLQARLSDPAVYNDHREAADVGRRLKELETPHKLAVAWQGARADLADARDDPELASLAADLESDVERLEEELKAALVERDPADAKDVIVEVRQGVGGDEAATLGRRRLPHADPLRGAPRLQDGGPLRERERVAAASRRSSSPSRATARSRSTSTRAARTACSACPRRSRRAGSTRRPRPSP